MAMQEIEQNISEYYGTIFTLKNGKEIKILTHVPYQEVLTLDELEIRVMISIDDGFIATPLLVPKSIEIVKKEIAAIESVLEKHLTWKNTELDIRSIKCNHPVDATCPECQPNVDHQTGGG